MSPASGAVSIWCRGRVGALDMPLSSTEMGRSYRCAGADRLVTCSMTPRGQRLIDVLARCDLPWVICVTLQGLQTHTVLDANPIIFCPPSFEDSIRRGSSSCT
jgi:hypothetical protein